MKAKIDISTPLRRPPVRQAPLSLANKCRRAVWSLAWLLLCRWTPPPFHGWRRIVLRVFGAQIGRGARPYPGVRVWAPWNLTMGDRSTLADGVDCYTVDRIVLGAGATVSQRAYLCTASRDIDDPANALMTAPILIDAGAWVAAEAYVGPGVTVGARGVVAARAVAIRDVGPGMVVGGNPAKPIRQRSMGVG